MTHGRQLVNRVARDVDALARWWTAASEKARYEILKASINSDNPPLESLRLAIIVAETEAGQVAEG